MRRLVSGIDRSEIRWFLAVSFVCVIVGLVVARMQGHAAMLAIGLLIALPAIVVGRMGLEGLRKSEFELVRSTGVFVFTVVAVMVLVRLLVTASLQHTALPEGTWLDADHCKVVTCIVSPDSSRYADDTALIAGRLSFPGALNVPGLLDGVAVWPVVRNGLFYSYVSAILMKALSITPQEAIALVSFLMGIVLALYARRYWRRRGLPQLPLMLLVFSTPVLAFANLSLKETMDAFLLFVLVANVEQILRPGHALMAVGAGTALYFEREYYLYIAAILLLLRALYYTPRFGTRFMRIAGLAVLLLAVTAAGRSVSTSLLEGYHRHLRPGETFFGLGAVVRGTLRGIFYAAIPRVVGIFDAPQFLGYGLLVFSAVRRRTTGARRVLTSVLNPYMATFLIVMVLFGGVYGGNYRARESLMFLFMIGFAEFLRHSRAEVEPAPERTPAELAPART